MTRTAPDLFDDWARRGRDAGMEEGHGPAVRAWLEPFLAEWPPDRPMRFLDLGCGNGWVVRTVAAHPACRQAIGVDAAPTMIERARERSADVPECSFQRGAFMDWTDEDGFDLVFSMEAFYYLDDVAAGIGWAAGLLRTGGTLAVLVDYYAENPDSESWPEDCGVPMSRHSEHEWAGFFRAASLDAIEQRRLCAGPQAGTLATWGTK